jgi:hypothetical protein
VRYFHDGKRAAAIAQCAVKQRVRDRVAPAGSHQMRDGERDVARRAFEFGKCGDDIPIERARRRRWRGGRRFDTLGGGAITGCEEARESSGKKRTRNVITHDGMGWDQRFALGRGFLWLLQSRAAG